MGLLLVKVIVKFILKYVHTPLMQFIVGTVVATRLRIVVSTTFSSCLSSEVRDVHFAQAFEHTIS